MIPYADFLYFGISLYALLPALVLRLLRRFWRAWIVFATVFMLAIQYLGITQDAAWPWNGFVLVVGYGLAQLLLAQGFLALRRRGPSRPLFYTAIALALLPLLAAKLSVAEHATYPLAFVGLSYVTFRCLDALIGIHDGNITELNPAAYFSFVLFFPAISSGPIDRYRRFAADWGAQRAVGEVLEDLDSGVHRVFTGFLYKFILAALIKQYWMDPVSQLGGLGHMLSYMYAYTAYLFFDFAGYSLFAVGFSHILGIHTPENFNRPFIARDIRDFWNRWHMSLSFWFRDHIYNRFIFAALKGRWFRSPQLASAAGYLLTMGLMGLWHGTALHFLAYGLYHGLLLAATSALDRRYKGNRLLNSAALSWHAASVVLTFHLWAFGLLVFSGRLF